jgi:hypothetical protein
VADHSFRVAAIAIALLCDLGGDADIGRRLRVLECALFHDLEEADSGDIPTPWKRKMDPRPAREPEFCRDLVSVADTIEALIFVARYVVRPRRLYSEHEAILDRKVREFYTNHTVELTEAVNRALAVGETYE